MPVAYATLADLEARFEERELVQLTDDANTGAIDQARIDQALASASAVVEGYVAATYSLDPDQPVPPLLVDCACDIARFKLYRSTPPEDVTLRQGQAIRFLEAIRKGTMKLDAGVETLAPRAGKVLTDGGFRRFGRDQMEGW